MIYKEFKKSEFSSKPPAFSPFILLSSLGLSLFTAFKIQNKSNDSAKRKEDSFNNLTSHMASPTKRIDSIKIKEDSFNNLSNHMASTLKRIVSFIKEPDLVPTLEPQSTDKPSILFDYDNLLSTTQFDISKFDFLHIKRAYCEEFLFYLAHYYELICISDRVPAISHKEIKEIDPLGCISYKIFINDKKDLKPVNLNRDLNKLIVISNKGQSNDGSFDNSEFDSEFDSNILPINSNCDLLPLMHFFTNLHFMNVPNTQDVISSYKEKGSDFIEDFKKTQERLFNQRNLFSFGSFSKKLSEINEKKVKDYKSIKMSLTGNFDYSTVKEYSFRFLRSVFL